MFEPQPSARADHSIGTLYAVTGENGWIYYGQVTAAGQLAFLRRRDRAQSPSADVLGEEVMSQVSVDRASLGPALRAGAWTKLGRFDPHPATVHGPDMVQWPFGTLTVTVWTNEQPRYSTRVEDPAIQHLEVKASWHATRHIPARLTADFGAEAAQWWVGGPLWRHRRVKEAYARLYPDRPWHRLPPDWVSTDQG